MSPISFSYTADQLKQLASIIERTTSSTTVDRDGLKAQLLDLMRAVGRFDDGTEYSAAFREFATLDPSHAELAKRFRKIAESDDPLDPELCSGIVLTELNQAARAKWARRIKQGLVNRPHPIRGVSFELLTEKERADVRKMASRLATFHKSLSGRGRPTKTDQHALVYGLAEIYIEFAQLNCHPYDLPHAQNSRFIGFASAALCPFFSSTEVSRKAISNHWNRRKDANS